MLVRQPALNCRLPHVERGDIVAFLDTGAYCESKALQFNAMPRPATVLVSGSRVEVITEREVLQDVTRRFRLPAQLIFEPTLSGRKDRPKLARPSSDDRCLPEEHL